MSIISNEDQAALSALSAAVAPFRQLNDAAPLPLSLLLTFINVAKAGRITVNDLSKAVGISQSAITRQLQEMSSRNRFGADGLNLIEQRIEGVYTMNSLTPKGQALARRMAGALDRVSQHPVRVAA
jgi:DNA-binding MarR family transcriptional regulator